MFDRFVRATDPTSSHSQNEVSHLEIASDSKQSAPMPNDHSPHQDTQARADLNGLLRFAGGLLDLRDRANNKVLFDIASLPMALTERDLQADDGALLPGIECGLSDESWFAFKRLRAEPPPPPGDELRPWLRMELRPSPLSPPVLLAERSIRVTDAKNMAALIEAGHVQQADIQDEPPWQVLLRPTDDLRAAFEAYQRGPWAVWAKRESPVRAAIKIYETLFKVREQIAASSDGGMDLIVGIGLARWHLQGRRLYIPLIEQRTEFDLDQANGTLTIRPRDVPPTPNLEAFVDLGNAEAPRLLRELRERLEQIARDPERGFGPFRDDSFMEVLEACASRLDSNGSVLKADEVAGEPGDALRISRGFCIMMRQRRVDTLRDDLRRMAEALNRQDGSLPETARRFVVPLSNAQPPSNTNPR